MALTSDSDLLPIEWAQDVIKEMSKSSAVLGLSRRRTMTTRQQRLPATAVLADAYWVGSGDNDFTDLKQQTNAEWNGVNLIVEELACLVGIPHAYEQDNSFPVWEEVRPQIVEAMGKRLDAAALFGVGKPSTWPAAILPSIVAAGQTVERGTEDDLAADIAESARVLKQQGFRTTGWAAEPGFHWELVGLRSLDGAPIYQPNLSGPINQGLYGLPLVEVENGAWLTTTDASVIHGDWSKSIVGIRQDITFTRHDSGVIGDSSGNIVFNAMQQDATIWRAVFRVAWARANPATRTGDQPGESGDNSPSSESSPAKFPWAAVVPAGS
ncbi:phage major capsid protein [Streptomyces aidingensis]|uniref:Phage major capsid protein, HK97 family n=1 Tax=Streptomyces aidingensis TaxID=910347 RepID=A0A1I1PWX4_9ACTN|nr:phage major capsid protein [Streptomyces aidingensis]SFD14285.1 phage major capsid protein, HK97 family [Streptomyces aidingensis]